MDDSENELEDQMNYILPRPWVSATDALTEKEIAATKVSEKRPRVRLQFTMKRKMFGQKLKLEDKMEAIYSLNLANEKIKLEYVRKRVNEIGLQPINPTVDEACQTISGQKVNSGIQVEIEKDDKPLNEENTKFMQFLRSAHTLMEEALCANETIDIFQDDFKLLANKFSDEAGSATELSIIKEIKSFEYQFCKKKVISCIRFCQKSDIFMRNVMATSFMEDLTFEERVEVSGRSYPNMILLWDYKDMHLFIPLLILESPLEITVFEFKPHDPNILIGKLSL